MALVLAFASLSIGRPAMSSTVSSPVEAPCFTNISAPQLTGHAALIVVTSHSKLGDQNCSSCKPTGVYGEELTAPYLLFRDAGMKVTIATIQGGDVPIDPVSDCADAPRWCWDSAAPIVLRSADLQLEPPADQL